jgi:hypothetical protein
MPRTSLSQAQVNAIRSFINKRGFATIEVEMEALDHLASKVEALLEVRPDMNFDLALSKAHSSFGIYGLSSLEESIEGGIWLRFKKRFLKSLLTYFITTKILITVVIAIVGYLLFSKYPDNGSGQFLHTSFLLYGFLAAIVPYLFLRKEMKRWEKRSSIVKMSTFSMYLTQFAFGQGFGLGLQMLSEMGSVYFPYVFVTGFTLLSLSVFINYDLMKWGLKWVEEKYLKFA